MKTYRVEMNNSKNAGNRYDPAATKGTRFFHVSSNSMKAAIESAEQQFPGECVSVIVKKMSSPLLKISNMQGLAAYELMSSPGSPNDTIIFRKNCQKMNVTLRGKDFTESGSTFWFDLSILNLGNENDSLTMPPMLTFSDLERISLEIYSIVQEKHIPAIFKGKMGLLDL